uniref:Uncharacterized protein n=1 Tax=Timema genevievae TaxID=629358 RepID=A0A7R9PK58_TIMGE|nr:unnamed protein product [Timema genevievae]
MKGVGRYDGKSSVPYMRKESAVLTINKHLNELESQIKLTKHEKDLNRLRKPQPDIQDGTSSVAPILLTTTQPKVVPATSDSAAGRQCSRYQFECRGSGECIAIYNACDGIVQCPDGSDEGPELGCPGPALPPGTTAPAPTIVPGPVLLPSWNQEQAPPALKRPFERTELGGRYVTDQKGPMQREPPHVLPPRNEIYGREGEGYGGAAQWPDYQPRQQQYKQMGRDYQEEQKPSSSGHIFNHKSSGLMMVETDRKIASPSKMKVPAEEGPLPQYADNTHTDYKYYNRQPGPPPPWTSNNHGISTVICIGSVPDDYYYEDPQETGRIHGHPSRQHPLLQPEPAKASGQSLGEVQPGPDKPQGKDSIDVYVVRNPKHPSSTSAPTTVTTVVLSVVKAKALPGPVEIPEDTVEVELVVDKENNPRGAILSLALGLCITAIMAVLVGCRLRVVRRRLRRGGKSPYAHDADYLVNGMYL